MENPLKTKLNFTKVIVALSFLALGSMAISGTALAQDPTAAATANWSVSYPVGYSDLDLSTAKGAKTLYLRIRYAAETLCESAATYGKKEGDACVNKAVNDAVAHVNAPQLTLYTESKGNKVGLVQVAKAN
jgi:UrcA family protein